jgi:hypothetical protein
VTEKEKQIIRDRALSLNLSISNWATKILLEKMERLPNLSVEDKSFFEEMAKNFSSVIELFIRLQLSLSEAQRQEWQELLLKFENLITAIDDYLNRNDHR